jgi:hypothetical protein
VVASALAHSSPAVTHAHYIEAATARRARTRRVIGKVAPDPALRRVSDAPSPATTKAPRVPTKRAPSRVSGDPALRVVDSGTTAAATPATEPTDSPQLLGKRVTPDELPRSQKDFRLFRRGDARGEDPWCEWSDSNLDSASRNL